MIKDYKNNISIDLDTGYIEDENVLVCSGGGKGAAPAAPVAQVNPAPPVQEASVEIEADEFEDDAKKKRQGGKGELKLPLTPTVDTGLKV